jgi:hypothetical protein
VLAQVNGSEKVQQFGEMAEKDLCDHWLELVDTAKKLGLSPPREIGATEKPAYVYLHNLVGIPFDEAFSKIVAGHYENIVYAYEKQASSDDRLSLFARQSAPMLKKHLHAAQLLSEKNSQA